MHLGDVEMMGDKLETVRAELDALHAMMAKRKASSYNTAEINRIREQQQALLFRIETLEKAQTTQP